jgi:hypothetical protein
VVKRQDPFRFGKITVDQRKHYPDGSLSTAHVHVRIFREHLTVGGHALYGNISQSANTAVGAFALAANNPGNQNVAVG